MVLNEAMRSISDEIVDLVSSDDEEAEVNHVISNVTQKHSPIPPGPTATSSQPKSYSPEDILRKHAHRLTLFERQEIQDYPQIWCIGHKALKFVPPPGGTGIADLFDDKDGYYRFVKHDHVAYRYELLNRLGKGAFGQVFRAYDKKTGEFVAIKIIRASEKYTRQAEVEIGILAKLRSSENLERCNIVEMLDSFDFRGHVCIVFELLSLNLLQYEKQHRLRGYPTRVVRKFAYALLVALEALARNNVVHTDLKPENIVLKTPGRSRIKIIDFGTSCTASNQPHVYIQSRWYRAPEVILGCGYGPPVDMWSFGCILAELYTGRVLLPGEDERDQMALIVELLGLPPLSLLMSGHRSAKFFNGAGQARYCSTRLGEGGPVVLRPALSKGGRPRGVPGSRELRGALNACENEYFLDLIVGCLTWEPEKRLTPQSALQHPFMQLSLDEQSE